MNHLGFPRSFKRPRPEPPSLENQIKDFIMALQEDVQKLVDAVAANTDAAKAVEAALTLEAAQIADLKAQLAAIVPGAPIGAEDLAAIQGAVSHLAEVNAELQAAVPANTTPGT